MRLLNWWAALPWRQLRSTAVPHLHCCLHVQAMVPCSEAEKEAQPVKIPFSTIIDAPVDCLWAKINDWSNDYSWVQDSQVRHTWSNARNAGA